jgi:hypothetical protein
MEPIAVTVRGKGHSWVPQLQRAIADEFAV